MKVIYFVRHGESTANVEKVFAGSRYDAPLTDVGLKQAAATGMLLKGKSIDTIISSPLKRAEQTAASIAEQIGYKEALILEPLLKERDFGAATGQSWDSGIGEKIDTGDIEDMETFEQLATRMQQLLVWLKTVPGEHVLVVGHGTVEAMLYTIYQEKPYATFLQTEELGNGMIREYRV